MTSRLQPPAPPHRRRHRERSPDSRGAVGLATRSLLASMALAMALAGGARADGPAPAADELLRLVPVEAGAVLAVDDLRGRWETVVKSSLAREVQELPMFRAWIGSPNVTDFRQARDRILGFLQVSHGQVRDDILGDAVVLAIFLPEGRSLDPSHARGLLVLKARDPALLRRLIDRIDEAQRSGGELAEVVEAERGGTTYATRRYPKGSPQLPESYVLFPDGVFAFSNSEPLIQDVIDRKTGAGAAGSSFIDAPGFREAADGLSGRPLARAFVAPGLVSRVLDSMPSENDPGGRKVVDALRDYLAATNRVGAALIVDDSRVQLQLVQAFKPESFHRLHESTFVPFRTGTDGIGPGPRLLDMPASALAAASFRIDVPGVYRFLVGLAPEKDQPKVAKLETIATALLMGLDLRSRVLPALGPRMIAYAEAADAASGARDGSLAFPAVAAIEINEEAARDLGGGGSRASTAEALGNALKAVLAALALDEKRAPATAQVRTRDGVTSLDVPYPFAFAIDPQSRRLIVGTSAEAVARYMEAGADAHAGDRFRAIRAAAFPDCEAFAYLDLIAFGDLAVKHRDFFVRATARRQGRSDEVVAPEFDQFMSLARLFDAAYLSGRVDAEQARVEHRIGLLSRPPASPASP
ncbi:hypothetical protein [Planctomyces sp. SH-PL62]|uniref:hypothetical protein n=1 Tax=Planctomyces sp. SH-PL62 TaxID=1636152 RepID=UPI00078C2DEE|nr:hypothetical protein [Planctomyces sp. SH-PL62]AMV37701.1 hypothetical protein VT85_09710 [Planctomyces sp. SH-PL62]